MRATARGVGIVATVAALTACSSSARPPEQVPTSRPTSGSSVVDGITIPPPSVTPAARVVPGPGSCPARFLTALNASSGRGTFTLVTERTAHLITCKYQKMRAASGNCTKSTIMVNTEPNAFAAFNRWNVETGQNSMWGHDPNLQPVPVAGIGIEAEWVPALLELGTANGTTWISVFLTCPDDTPAALSLAEVLATEGLAST